MAMVGTGGPLIPSHCKVVGKLHLDGPITLDIIMRSWKGKKAYKLTEFYCVTNGEEWAVLRVRKAEGPRLLLPIEEVEVLALPDTTAYVVDPGVDTTNPTAMLEVADGMPEDVTCVVVQGEYNHMSFLIRDGDEVRVRVLDVVPPYPSKVSVLARRALDCRPLPVLLDSEEVDLKDLAKGLDPECRLFFPCRAGGLELDRPGEYLDEVPPLAEGEDVVLVGCNLSERIFREHYGRRPIKVITMCPKELALEGSHEGWTLVKCCKEKGPFGIHGHVVAIPWSATKGDTAAALEEIVQREKAGRHS
jgi:hypothetical protein